MQKYRITHFLFAALFGMGVMLFCWLVFFGPSPTASSKVTEILQNMVAYINIIPVELSARSQNYGIYPPITGWFLFVLIFVQWFVVGYGLSLLFRRLHPRRS